MSDKFRFTVSHFWKAAAVRAAIKRVFSLNEWH